MSAELVIKLIKHALEVTFVVSTPLLLVSLVVGVLVSVLQVVTSIQDPTVSFIPKMLALFVVFLLVFPWMLNYLVGYMSYLFSHLHEYVR